MGGYIAAELVEETAIRACLAEALMLVRDNVLTLLAVYSEYRAYYDWRSTLDVIDRALIEYQEAPDTLRFASPHRGP